MRCGPWRCWTAWWTTQSPAGSRASRTAYIVRSVPARKPGRPTFLGSKFRMPSIDYRQLRSQLSMRRVLQMLGYTPLRAAGDQWRGPRPLPGCPISRPRCFSVRVRRNNLSLLSVSCPRQHTRFLRRRPSVPASPGRPGSPPATPAARAPPSCTSATRQPPPHPTSIPATPGNQPDCETSDLSRCERQPGLPFLTLAT